MAFLDRLIANPRERRLLGIVGLIAAVVGLVLGPIGMEMLVRSKHAENDEIRQALADVQDARSKIRERQRKKDAILARYAKRAPALAGFIEQSARAHKLEVTDSVDRPDVPLGKRYIERGTQVHLKKAGLAAISRFLETMEKSGNALAVTRLNIRKRGGEQDSYDVEVGVSAYDRNEPKAAESAQDKGGDKSGDKAGDKDKKP